MTNDPLPNGPEQEPAVVDEAAERLDHDLAVANDVHTVPAEPPGREPGATAADDDPDDPALD